MRQGDHSATSGISVSLLLERLSSPKLGSSRRHFGTVVRSLCWRSILTTYMYKLKQNEKCNGFYCFVFMCVCVVDRWAKLKKKRSWQRCL